MEATSTDSPRSTEIRRRPATPVGDLFKPHESIPRPQYLVAAFGGVILLFIIWSILSYGGFVKPSFFLPTPSAVLASGWRMVQTGEMWDAARASTTIIVLGWILAVIIALPLGVLIGTFKFFEALFEPVIDFFRYLPVSALIPLLILYIGIDEREKIAVIFLGTVFQLILMVADVTSHVAKDLLDSAYTLGASRVRVLTTVLLPATLPGVLDALRITFGWAWTYIIVAELVAAEHGLGITILESQRGLRTDKIFATLVVIGWLGFASDFLFKWLHPRLLPWSSRQR